MQISEKMLDLKERSTTTVASSADRVCGPRKFTCVGLTTVLSTNVTFARRSEIQRTTSAATINGHAPFFEIATKIGTDELLAMARNRTFYVR